MSATPAAPEPVPQPAPDAPVQLGRPERPRRRSECPEVRPCVWAAGECRYGLLHGECALDFAAQGGLSDAEIGAKMGVSRSRVGQIVESALDKLRLAAEEGAFVRFLDADVIAELRGTLGYQAARAARRGAVLRALDAGLTQSEVVAALDVTPGFVGKIAQRARSASSDVVAAARTQQRPAR